MLKRCMFTYQCLGHVTIEVSFIFLKESDTGLVYCHQLIAGHDVI